MRSSRSAPDRLFAGSGGFAHRGLHSKAVPENTLAAFHAAIEAGVGIECDLRLSRDGFAMVVHDSNLSRLCGVEIAPESLHAAALSSLPVAGTSEHIPLLGDLLELVDGRVPLLLELKRSGLPDQPTNHLCRAVAATLARYTGPLGVMSFDPTVSNWFARHAPHIRRGLVVHGDERWWRRVSAIALARPQFVALGLTAITQPWAARLRSTGMPIPCWTISNPDQRAIAARLADALIWEADGRPRS
ncbi:MAG: hypothetical protein M3Q88_02735 [Pseudomonadota bacterium]|nr:hypothetical protein [Pseudomonadota bacterium]